MNKLLSIILDQANLGIILVDRHYQITLWNGWMERLTQKRAADVMGRSIFEVCPRLDKDIYRQIIHEALQNGRSRVCSGALHKAFVLAHGETEPGFLTRQNMQIDSACWDDANYALIQIFDITGQAKRVDQLKSFIKELELEQEELKASEQMIKHQAYHDSLTALPNRYLLTERIDGALAQAQCSCQMVALLFMDLDQFKFVNDCYGHVAGDYVLQEVANRLKRNIRREDTISRLGGDEFIVLLPNMEKVEHIVNITQKIKEMIAEPLECEGHRLRVTASIGVALFPNDASDAEALIRYADSAMYQAKSCGGNIYRFYSLATKELVQQIAERKQAEEALRRSESKYRDLIQNMIDGFAYYKLLVDDRDRVVDAIYLEVNAAYERISGFSKDELIGRRFTETTLGIEQEKREWLEIFGRVALTGREATFEQHFPETDRWMLCSAYSTEPGYFAVSLAEITKRKRAERSLIASEERYRNIFQNAQVAILQADCSEIKKALEELRQSGITDFHRYFLKYPKFVKTLAGRLKVKDINGTALAMFDVTKQELEGFMRQDLMPQILVSFHKFLLAMVNHAQRWEDEITVQIRNGRIWQGLVNFNRPEHDDSYSDVLFTMIDITAIRRAEQEKIAALARAGHAERMASLGIMVAGVAHEINQPLQSLKVTVDGMLYWHERGVTAPMEKVIENCRRISAQASRIDKKIKQMRSYVQRNRQILQGPTDLNQAVAGALDIVGSQLQSHGIQIRQALASNLPPIWGEMGRLEEIVVNLLVNAMQAMDTVTQGQKEIGIETRLEDEGIVMEINDTGPGLDDTIKDKIFEAFFTTKKITESMGLGLAIVYSIVTSYNGQISALNNPQGGATFRVIFPACYVERAEGVEHG